MANTGSAAARMGVLDNSELWIVAMLILPGFISIRIHEMLFARPRRDWAKSLIEIVSYSVLNFGVFSWLIYSFFESGLNEINPQSFGLAIAVVFVVGPALYPILFRILTTQKFYRRFFLSPYSQPWDFFFDQREPCWVKVHMKSGAIIHGAYGTSSSASRYPEQRQLYLQELWLPTASGGFKKKRNRSKGALIFEPEISYIEFVEN